MNPLRVHLPRTNPLDALRRVFAIPTGSSTNPTVHSASRLPGTPAHARRLTTTPALSVSGAYNRSLRFVPSLPHPDRDEGISARTVRVVSSLDSSLGPPTPLYSALRTLDREVSFLVRVSPADDPGPPVCKILPKRRVYEQEKERQIAAHAANRDRRGNKKVKKQRGGKIVEIGWGIERGDLETRVGRIRGFLGKGQRVEVVFLPKKKARVVGRAEMEGVLGRVRDGVEGAGGKVVGEDGTVGGVMKLVVERRDDSKQREESEETKV